MALRSSRPADSLLMCTSRAYSLALSSAPSKAWVIAGASRRLRLRFVIMLSITAWILPVAPADGRQHAGEAARGGGELPQRRRGAGHRCRRLQGLRRVKA